MFSLNISASQLSSRATTESPLLTASKAHTPQINSNVDNAHFSLNVSASHLKSPDVSESPFCKTPALLSTIASKKNEYSVSPDLFESRPASRAVTKSPAFLNSTTPTFKTPVTVVPDVRRVRETSFFHRDSTPATPMSLAVIAPDEEISESPFTLKFTGPSPGGTQNTFNFDFSTSPVNRKLSESPFFLKDKTPNVTTPGNNTKNIEVLTFDQAESQFEQEDTSIHDESLLDRAFHEVSEANESECSFVGRVLEHSSDEEDNLTTNGDEPIIVDDINYNSLKEVDDRSPSSIIANSMASILLNADTCSCYQGFNQFGATNSASFAVKATERLLTLNGDNVKRTITKKLRSDVWLGEEIERSRALLQLCRAQMDNNRTPSPKVKRIARKSKSTSKKNTHCSKKSSNSQRRLSFEKAGVNLAKSQTADEMDQNESFESGMSQ